MRSTATNKLKSNIKQASRFKSPNKLIRELSPGEDANELGYNNNTFHVIEENEGVSDYDNNYQTYNEQKAFQTVKPGLFQDKNLNKFHKLGTLMNHNIRKISIMDQNRRNTQFQNINTQDIVEDISEFVRPSAFSRQQRDGLKSPQPQLDTKFRAFSPYNISELDESCSLEDGSKDDLQKNRNNVILEQFHDRRKVVSPSVRQAGKDMTPNLAPRTPMGVRYKSPLPGKPLPLVSPESTRNTPLLSTKYVCSENNSRNNSRLNVNGSKAESNRRTPSRNNQNTYNTI